MKYFVTITDKFMSGWGHARGLRNKLVFECDSYDEALIVAENAENRTDQKNVNICSRRPWYSPKTCYVQFKTKEEYPSWYEKGYFKRN